MSGHPFSVRRMLVDVAIEDHLLMCAISKLFDPL
jgi:hypothetical protein